MKKLLLAFIIFCCLPFTLLAQKRVITGNVVDGDGSPAQGVNVSVKGNKKEAVQTDKSGNFSITVIESGKVALSITSTEFKSKTVNSDGSSPVTVKLERNVSTQDEVVVIGYQTVKRKDLTGAVSSLGSKEIKDVPVNSATEALTGRVAGVQVTTDEGAPGSDATIKVRGGGSITQDNSPLYVIDGIQVDDGLSNISPQDIESIDVLKDASATAIYGARGANGVIIITTKGGKNTKGKTVVSYNGFVGAKTLSKEIKMMDPYNFVQYQYEAQRFGDSSGYVGEYGAADWDSVSLYKGKTPIDWQREVFGQRALTQTHNLSLSGGTDVTQYNLSFTDNEEQGIQLGSGFNRKLLSFKFDHKASDKLKFGFNARYNRQEINGAGTGTPDADGSAATSTLRQVNRYHPFKTANDELDPSRIQDFDQSGIFLVNPLLLISNQYKNNATNVINLSGNVNYSFSKFISFKSTVGYDVNTNDKNTYDDSLTSISKKSNAGMPILGLDHTVRTTLNNSNVLTYSNAKAKGKFKDNNDLDALVGEEIYQTYTTENENQLGFASFTSVNKALNNLSLGTQFVGQLQSTAIPVHQLSFFSRVNYTFKKKYLATATFRADGSSIFGPDHKWGYFPAGSLAWKISEEKFMQKVKFISDMKLRLSYGEAGNNRIAAFSYLNQFYTQATTASGATGTPVQYGPYGVGYAPIQLGNSDLKWETTISKNIGLDVGFFHNRLNFTGDVYQNDTRDLLVNITIPSTSGYLTQIKNVGSTRNQGVELQLQGNIIQKKSFTWSATFNMSFNKNTVIDLGGVDSILYSSNWAGLNYAADYKVQVGKSLGQIYGYINDGWYTTNDFTTTANPLYVQGSTAINTKLPLIYHLKPGIATNTISGSALMPGMAKYKDLNHDSIINAADETVIGRAAPKFFGGLNQQFTYKAFDMSIFINFQYGNQVYNANRLEYTSGYNTDANMLALMNTRWRTINPADGSQIQTSQGTVAYGVDPGTLNAVNANATIWNPSKSFAYLYPQSFAVEDASFIRINNITVGYSLATKLLSKAKIARLRIYGTINNLATITGYSGYDPEVNTRRATPLTPGVDYSAYPRSRTYIVGVNLSL